MHTSAQSATLDTSATTHQEGTSVRMLIVRNSANKKTGKVRIATYRTQDACPPTCPLMGHGCYGENNGVGGSATPFGHASRGIDTDACATLRTELMRLNPGDVIRVNVVGDYLRADGTPDTEYIDTINEAATVRGIIVLAYTHAWRTLSPDMFVDNARPQASCDNADDIATARAAGWSTVIVDPDDMYTGGNYVTCPNVTRGIQCVDCKLCARQRKSTVVFPVHGTKKNSAKSALKARN